MSKLTDSAIKRMSPQLLVTDLERSIEFYTRKLGFDLDFRYGDFYAGIIKHEYSIHLKSGHPSIEERKRRRINEDLDIVFSVDGIEDLYEEMLTSAAEIIQPLRQMPYAKEFYVADPDGYIIGFLEEA
jgi:catechol 2,3-dioxygenase-like lactoylglutathione lyase family enzyme